MITYYAAIIAGEKGQQLQHALHMFQKLQPRGPMRTVINYNAAISACEEAKLSHLCSRSCSSEASCAP